MTEKKHLIIFCFLIAKVLLVHSQQTSDTLFISTAEELKTFSRNVNDGNSYQSKVIQLTQDIFLNDTTLWQRWDSMPAERKEQWNPIGHLVDRDSIMAFQGTFDGKGHCIYGIYINRKKTGVFQGLFGAIKNATVKNLSIKASVIMGYLYTGGIAAHMGGISTINNCHNFGKIIGIRNQVGGVVASLNTEASTAIINCSNSGSIRGKCIIGGIIGSVYANNERKGRKKKKMSYGLAIYNCFNRGTIAGYRDVGGIVGLHLVEANANRVDTIANCYNAGNILAQYVAGGICGTYKIFTHKGIYGKPSLSNCYNAGTVSIIYSTATNFLVGDLNNPLVEGMAKHSSPCYYIIQTGTVLPRERAIGSGTPFIAFPSMNILSPHHFYALPSEEIQYDSFVDKLNAFVADHPDTYKKWKRDTESINGGFPIFAE